MRLAACVVALLPACGGSSSPGTPDAAPGPDAPRPIDPRFAALAAAIEADLEQNLATAASVAVWLDEEIVWVGGFGTIEPGGRVPGESTLFMIGSDTKKLTGISVLRRVQAGQATLDSTVADVVPQLQMMLAPDFTGATLRDLLSHQGGLVDNVEVTATTTDESLESYVLGEFARTYYQMAPPGRIWNYSNPNFSVAGLLDQRLDGRMWPDLVEQDLFAPLGMTRTVARKTEVDGDHAPGVGYSSANPADMDTGPVPLEELWESAFVRPSGLVWSTPGDQMRLARFLVDGDAAVLSAALRAEVTSPQVPAYPDIPGAYGFGLSVDRGIRLGSDYYDVPVWSHGGDTRTHSSTFFILPEQRFAISILSNGTGDDFTASLVAALSSLVTLPAPSTAPTLPFDPAGLDALTGTYVDMYNVGTLNVTRVGDSLEIQAPTLEEYGVPYERQMTSITTRVWIARIQGIDLDLSFIDGPDGETYLRNRIFVAIRPPTTSKPTRPVPPRREAVLAALRDARRTPVPLRLRLPR